MAYFLSQAVGLHQRTTGDMEMSDFAVLARELGHWNVDFHQLQCALQALNVHDYAHVHENVHESDHEYVNEEVGQTLYPHLPPFLAFSHPQHATFLSPHPLLV